MELVNVKRDMLLEKVKENCANHRSIFEDAQEVYRERMIAELDSMLADATAGRKIRRAVSMPEPEDHTRDYERVLSMLAMSVDDVIELSEHDFARYVMDQWEWNASFALTTTAYAAQNVHRK